MIKDYVYRMLLNAKERGRTFVGPALEEILSIEKPEKYLPVIVEIRHDEVKKSPMSTFISELELE